MWCFERAAYPVDTGLGTGCGRAGRGGRWRWFSGRARCRSSRRGSPTTRPAPAGLFGKRWPDGFRCPGCGHAKGWELGRGALLVECARCRRQTSVTAGTVLHRGHLPLKLWFLAAWLVATHRNGMSARQLWSQLGLGSYKTAWLLLRKLRHAMVDPDREPLAGPVEVGETGLPFRAGGEPGRPRRAPQGKLPAAGAVGALGEGPGP